MYIVNVIINQTDHLPDYQIRNIHSNWERQNSLKREFLNCTHTFEGLTQILSKLLFWENFKKLC